METAVQNLSTPVSSEKPSISLKTRIFIFFACLQVIVLISWMFFVGDPWHVIYLEGMGCSYYLFIGALGGYISLFFLLCLLLSFFYCIYGIFASFRDKKASIFFVALSIFCFHVVLNIPVLIPSQKGIGLAGVCVALPDDVPTVRLIP